MKELKRYRGLSLLTTIMDFIILFLFVFVLVMLVIGLTGRSQVEYYTGEINRSSLIIIYILLAFFSLLVAGVFGFPAIYGIISYFKEGRIIDSDRKKFFQYLMQDAKIKLMTGMIPVISLIVAMISKKAFTLANFLFLAYFAAILIISYFQYIYSKIYL